MSTKTNNLYPHPFSKAYWRDAVSELKDVITLTPRLMVNRLSMTRVVVTLARYRYKAKTKPPAISVRIKGGK